MIDLDTFWQLIEASRDVSTECEAQAAALTRSLAALDPAEIISFQEHRRAQIRAVYSWDLWAVAYIVNGGCSDDGFEYFRGWLLGQGRAYFEAALADPVRAADRAPEDDDAWCEDILYVAYKAYENRTGATMPLPDVVAPLGEPLGEPWDEDELERLYPDLWRRFGY